MSYVVFEGPDFAGKSTLTKKVAAALGWCLVAEPFTETPNAARIKQAIINNEYNPQTEIFMLAANRLEAFNSVISPNRQAGVIADRSVISSMVYQKCEGWSQLTIFDFMNKIMSDHHHELFPDHLFFLEIDHATYLDRLEKSDRGADEKEKALMIEENWNKLIAEYKDAIEWAQFRNNYTGAKLQVHFITPQTTVEEIVALIQTKK